MPELTIDWSYFCHAALEIIVLFFIIYGCIAFARTTRAPYIFLGIMGSFILLSVTAYYLNFTVITWVMSQFWSVVLLAFIMIFQPELRRFFAFVGEIGDLTRVRVQQRRTAGESAAAAIALSRVRIGALIVFERKVALKPLCSSPGIALNAAANAKLIEAIFYPNGPLHDGALIIKDMTMIAGHAILPLARVHDQMTARNFGTRHRAGIGITEDTDAIALIVSEETGAISLAQYGKLYQNIAPDELESTLSKLLNGDIMQGGVPHETH